MQVIWFSLMLGWLAKVLILRVGGASLFGMARAVFIGMIIGEAVSGGVWLVVALVMNMFGVPRRGA